MKPQIRSVIFKISVCAVSIVMIALCSMYMYAKSKVIYYIAVTLLIAAVCAYCAVDEQTHRHVSRTLFVATIVVCLCAALYMIYYYTGLSEKFSDFDELKTLILDSGFWGAAIFVMLTIFQVVVLPVPEAVTILLGVAIYGATVSFILSVIGTVIGSLISFSLGKIFGRRLCNWMFGEQNTQKYAELVAKRGKFVFIIMLLFPAFPDDMLCMIAGITDMTYPYFLTVVALTRPVMIGLTAYLGSGMIPFEGWGIPVWIAIACLMFVAFIVISKIKSRIEKGQKPKERRISLDKNAKR